MAGTSGSIRKQQEKIKQQMRDDIKGTQSVANQLTGKEEIGTKKLRETKSKTTTTTKPALTKAEVRKLDKFFDFMEKSYKSGLSKVEIKRKI